MILRSRQVTFRDNAWQRLAGEGRDVKTERQLKHELREARSSLRSLTASVDGFLKRMDIVMIAPADTKRGMKVAALTSALDLQNQIAKRYGLGMSVKKASQSSLRGTIAASSAS